MAWMAALPAIIGGVSSAFGAARANQSSRRAAERAMEFEAGQAQVNRDFQERMSSTAHQREVKDLMSAGLNPMLSSMGGSGASSPSGSMASGSTPQVQNVGAGVTSALQAQNLSAQNQLLQAQAKQANANAGLATASSAIPATIADVVNGIKKFLGDSTGKDTTGVLESARGGVTNVIEAIANSAGTGLRNTRSELEAGSGVLKRGFETMKHSAGSVGAEGVEILRRVDQLIDEANRKFMERMRGDRRE